MKRRKTKQWIGYAVKLNPDGEIDWSSLRQQPNYSTFIMLPTEYGTQTIRHEEVSYAQDNADVTLTFAGPQLIPKGEKPKFWHVDVQYPSFSIEEKDEDDESDDNEPDESPQKCFKYLTRAAAEKGFGREIVKLKAAFKREVDQQNALIPSRRYEAIWRRLKPRNNFRDATEILETQKL
jgi:hypothetical protein